MQFDSSSVSFASLLAHSRELKKARVKNFGKPKNHTIFHEKIKRYFFDPIAERKKRRGRWINDQPCRKPTLVGKSEAARARVILAEGGMRASAGNVSVNKG